MKKIGIVGAGAWGTALGHVIQKSGYDVCYVETNELLAKSLNGSNKNPNFDKDFSFLRPVEASTEYNILKDCQLILIVAPSQKVRHVCQKIAHNLEGDRSILICSKGIEEGSLDFLSDIAKKALKHNQIAVLSGPSFASEVVKDQVTALSIASEDSILNQDIIDTFTVPIFRFYPTNDVIGVQLASTMKNVVAIACGIIKGMGAGDNTHAATFNQGIIELTKLLEAFGCAPETIVSPAGIGDMALTCYSHQSRNFSFGYELGKAGDVKKIMDQTSNVLKEGVIACRVVKKLAVQKGVQLKLAESLAEVLEGKLPLAAVGVFSF